VDEGRAYHKDKRDDCAFCGNPITVDRWEKLEKHFDEESSKLEKEIDALIKRIESEKQSTASALSINKSSFYSTFHERLDGVIKNLKAAVEEYSTSLDFLISQLQARKNNILNPQAFKQTKDTSAALLAVWNEYETIRTESEAFTTLLSDKQSEAKLALRLDEV